MCVSIFFTIFVWNIFHFKNWATYEQKCILVFIQTTRYSRRVWKIFETYQILWKSVQREPSCTTRTEGRTDRHDEANSRFPQFCERA
jgi:hypothetical protein